MLLLRFKHSVIVFASACVCGAFLLQRVAEAQDRASQSREVITLVSGKVVDASGTAVSGITVKLRSKASTIEENCKTDTRGRFVFRNTAGGPLELIAEKDGEIIAALGIAGNSTQPILLQLKQASTKSTTENEISFADGPNFTVAGVTDWTAVGGHGSDATLRTSEDLARTTAALRGTDGIINSGDHTSEEQLQSAVRADPGNYAANLALGECYLHKKEYALAVPVLRTASAANPELPSAEFDLALAYRGLGDLTAAQQHVQRALHIADRAEYHQLEGELDEAAGDPFAAVQQMQRAVQLDPSEGNYFSWGSELLLHRAILQASQVFARGAVLFPSSARIHTGWGTALFAEAKYEEAAQRLCEASDLEPDSPEPYLVLGKADNASPTVLPGVMERFERYLKLKPKNAMAHFLLAAALMKRDPSVNASRAQALLERAIALDPQLAGAYLELGKIAAAKKQFPEAIDWYRKAIAADSQLGEAHFRLAVLYERTGNASEAKHERELHESIERHQADIVEAERRSVKQFLMVLQGSASSSHK